MDLRYGPEIFFLTKGKYNRPEIKLDIYRVGNEDKEQVWDIFRKYHYLNTNIAKAGIMYVGMINGEMVCV